MRRGEYSDLLALAANENVKERDFWLKQLSGEWEKTGFPYDKKISAALPPKRDTVTFKFPHQLVSTFIKLSKDSYHTLHMVLTAGVTLLLEKYTRNTRKNNDIMIGTPVYKQDTSKELINTFLILRNPLPGEISFKDLLMQVRQTIIEAVHHQNYPLDTLAEKLNDSSSGNDFPLFEVAVLLENIQERAYIDYLDLNMVFSFVRNHEGIAGRLEYNALLYKKSTAERIIHHLTHLFETVFLKKDLPLSAVEVMPENEKKQLLFDLNKTTTQYPRDQTLPRLFAEQVENTSGNTALVFADKHLSYRKLNEQANQLAGILKARGVKPGNIVGLLMDRSIEMIIGILGILKAGGAYLPLEVNSPQERMVSMLEESQARLLLTTRLAAGYSFSTLQGLTIKRIPPYRTALRPCISDLDSLPLPDRSLVDYSKYHQYTGAAMVKYTLPVFSSRGCPYQCAYCHKLWPKKQIFRSAENLFREVKLHYDMGIRRFSFLDDIFNLQVKNSSKFFQMVLREGLDAQFYFSNGLRSDILTKEFIDLMIEAGTINFMMALESASPRIQKLIGKNLNIERFRENLQYIIKKYPHLLLEVNIMIGFPSETEEEALSSLEFIKEHQWIHFPNLNILKIYPNTDMEKLALQHGISVNSLESSLNQAYHQLGETLPFGKNFVRQYQVDLLNNYFLKKERLLAVLPYQIKAMSADELVQKYDSYLPTDISSFSQLLNFIKINTAELGASENDCPDDSRFIVPDFQQKVKQYWMEKENRIPTAPVDSSPTLKVLLLELSKTFTSETPPLLYDVMESPFGLIQLLTYLNHQFKGKIEGKIAHSRVDFDNLEELKALVEEFKPDVIGIRTLTFYKDFFHQTIAAIRQWGIEVPIISGGPYATSDWEVIIQDCNIDLVVIGEGEITFAEIIGKMIENNGKLPGEEVLKEIPGIAFCPSKEKVLEKGTFAREIIMMDQIREVLNSEPVIPLPGPGKNSTAAQLAYVVFTSGSTGKPKGVLTTHYNVTRVVRNNNYIDLTVHDRVLQLSNYAFDGAVFDIYGALLNGAVLVLMSGQGSSAVNHLAEIIKQEQVTVFFITTALFNLLVDLDPGIFKQVKKVLFGGERISVDHARRALEYSGSGKLIHVYGPTETTVYASYYKIDHIQQHQETVPIGKPIANTTLYILDNNMQAVPIMVPGEIYIGGDGSARGYLNRPELTAEKFVEQVIGVGGSCDNKKFLRGGPVGVVFSKSSPPGCRRLYKTGDLARWQPGRDIEFLGRVDNQVKIRGFRVELEEIEKQLVRHPEIREAVVMIRQGESGCQSYINAYIVASSRWEKHQLREFLLKELPDYMIPTYFIPMDKIPLTSNGKVDREQLAALDLIRQDQYAAPGTGIEKTIASIWEELLGIELVGLHDNFFEVGGNSLNIIRVNSRLKDEFSRELPLVSMFTYPTVYEYARYLEQEQGTGSGGDTDLLEDRSEVKQRGRNNLQKIRRRKSN